MTIYEKLLEVQKEIGAIKKDSKNPFFKSNYFDINSLLAAVKPVLNKYGLVLTQGLTHIEGKLALCTKIGFGEGVEVKDTTAGTFMGNNLMEGDSISYTCPLPETTDAQKAGSAITYFRRYALQSLLALEAEDDDGEGSKQVSQPKIIIDPRTKSPIMHINSEVEDLIG